MKMTKLVPFAAILVFASYASAQDTKAKQDPHGQEGMAPKPGPEHANLALAEGTWHAVVEMAGSPPSKGTSEMRMVLGGFWLEDRFTADFGGMKFEGRGMTGFDPIKGKFVGTWVDSMSPGLMVSEGTFDAKTRTLTMVGNHYDEAGAPVKVRMLTIHKDANTVVFEMHRTGADGKEGKVLTITYTRAAAAATKPAK